MSKYSNSSFATATAAYGSFLNQLPWTYFATLTTGYEMTLPSARRAAQRYHKLLKRAGSCEMFWAAEPFDCKEGYHIHALIKTPQELHYKNVVDLWQTASGAGKKDKPKWNRIDLQRYDPKRGACSYLSKYVSKKLSDYDFLL